MSGSTESLGRARSSWPGRSGSSESVRARSSNGVWRIELARPERRNALDAEMVASLAASLEAAGADPSARVVAIRGAEPDFCAGADLRAVAASQEQGPEVGLADAQRLGEVFVRIRRLSAPVVAVVVGRALAGGCALATACDLVVAREDARFGYPETSLGFVPAMAAALLRRRVGESAAFDLAVRGKQVGAARARELGLANEVFPSEGFDERADEYLAELAALPPMAVGMTKRLLHGLEGAPLDEAVARGAEVNALARLTRECREGVAAFLGGRGRPDRAPE